MPGLQDFPVGIFLYLGTREIVAEVTEQRLREDKRQIQLYEKDGVKYGSTQVWGGGKIEKSMQSEGPFPEAGEAMPDSPFELVCRV